MAPAVSLYPLFHSISLFVHIVIYRKPATAQRWWKRYSEENTLKTRDRTGRLKILSEEIVQSIMERIRENPFLTAVEFAREYNVSVHTISKILKQNGLKCRTAASQTKLTEQHREKRLAFCRLMLNEWDDDKLGSIVFSDEKTFCTDVSWRTKVYRPFNTRYDPLYVQTTHRSGRITNNWGAICNEGPITDLATIDGRFNSSQYLRILRAHVLPVMRDSNRVFMQDNSPVHKSGRVMAWFARQNFELMDWPALSPDLNPIENVWSYMENGWPVIHPRNTNTLHQVVQERWTELRDNRGEFFTSVYKFKFSSNELMN